LKENGKSDGIMEILGINAISPFAGPVRMTASIILFRNDFIYNLVRYISLVVEDYVIM
jgi:hypothetical protein